MPAYVGKHHVGKSRDRVGPRPGESAAAYHVRTLVGSRLAGWLGWLSGFPGCAPTSGLAIVVARYGRSHGILMAGLKKLRKTHENGDSNFPKSVVKTVTGWKKISRSAARHGARVAFVVSTCDYCYYLINRPHPSFGTRATAESGARLARAAGWYPGTIARISSAKCDSPRHCRQRRGAATRSPMKPPPRMTRHVIAR